MIRFFLSFLLPLLAISVSAQQAAAPYTHATRYNAAGQVTGTIAPDPDEGGVLAHKATRNTYGVDGATRGLLIKVESGELASWANELVEPKDWSGFNILVTKTFSYDAYGRKIAERSIGEDDVTIESLVEYSYDDWDRVRCRAVRMNPAGFAANSPDVCAPNAPGIYGADRITRYTYDALGQVLTEERAVGTPRQQTYVTNFYIGRRLETQTDANGNLTDLEYDANSRLKKRIYPSPTTPGTANTADFNEYTYDANGNVVLEKKRDGRTIAFQYDANNRLIFKNLSDNSYSGDIAYDYDLRGLTLATCFGNGALDDDCRNSGAGETNDFDGFGNLTARTSRMSGVSRILTYSYDLEGNRTQITHPDGNYFAYGFDGLNRFNVLMENAAVDSSTQPLLTIGYRPGGGRESISRLGDATTTITLDNARRLDAFTQNLAGSAHDLTNDFDYNPASQVVRLGQSNTLYTYTDNKSRVGVYTPNGLNQYTNVDEAPIGHDANGNLVSDAASSSTFTYDIENHLVAMSGTVEGQAVTASLVYDVLGRLAQTTIIGATTQLHYDGDALIGEYVGGTLTRRYVHGDRVDEPLVQYAGAGLSTERFLHADHQGSVIAQSDGAGASVQTNSYDSYGIPASTNDGRFAYTGQTWLKQLGLYYYKARVYSPSLGRFLQTDPIFYADNMNMYAYAGNDPFNRRDSSGLAAGDTYTSRWHVVKEGEFAGEWYIITPASGHRVVWPSGRPETGSSSSATNASQAFEFIVEPVEEGADEESPDSAVKSIDTLGRIQDFDVQTRTENASNFDGPVPNDGGTMNDENEDGSPVIPLTETGEGEAQKGSEKDPDFLAPPLPVIVPEPQLPL